MIDGDKPTDDLESTELSPPSASPAEQIGPYRLLQRLSEGGMGEVWLAEQQQPVKRKVALKVIKQGMDTKQVVARVTSGTSTGARCSPGSFWLRYTGDRAATTKPSRYCSRASRSSSACVETTTSARSRR